MTRDFASKNRGGRKKTSAGASARKSGAQEPPAPWAWFLAGLFCGVFLAGLTWLASQQPDPAVQNVEAAKPRQDSRPKPRFDFYTLLPEQRIDVDMEPEAMATATADEPRDQYLLQAGSFSTHADADRRRAELALQGIESNIQRVKVNDRDYHRVYIGPTDDLDELNMLRSRLRNAKIDVLRIRVSD